MPIKFASFGILALADRFHQDLGHEFGDEQWSVIKSVVEWTDKDTLRKSLSELRQIREDEDFKALQWVWQDRADYDILPNSLSDFPEFLVSFIAVIEREAFRLTAPTMNRKIKK